MKYDDHMMNAQISSPSAAKPIKVGAGTLNKLANLLATEDLTVEHNPTVSTASFDVKNRVLTLPVWKNMTESLYHMLVLHEVGHALYTPHEEWIEQASSSSNFRNFLNVIEDARIERKMKIKYPGARRDFFDGYKFLNENDFFKLKHRELSKLSFIDRVNTHFKLGSILQVPFFNDIEKQFVRRIETAMTFDEVIEIAEDMYEYAKELNEKQEMPDMDSNEFGSGFDGDEESFEDSGETDPNEEEQDSDSSNKTESEYNDENPVPNEMTAETVDNLEKQINENLVDRSQLPIHYNDIREPVDSMDYVESYKDLLANLNKKSLGEITHNHFMKFQNKNAKAISYMVKEFEMKKAADQYLRARTAKTGVINPNTLHSYSFNDDVFRRLTVLPGSKNHGLFMLIDFSGSMSDIIKDTIDQLLNLVMFCRKVNIPHRVYAFQDSLGYDMTEKHGKRYVSPYRVDKTSTNVNKELILMELFHEKMRTSEFRQMANHVLGFGAIYDKNKFNPAYYTARVFKLNGTPLNDALIVIRDMLHKFRKETSAQIVNLVTLTDGDSQYAGTNNIQRIPSWYGSRAVYRDSKTKMQMETNSQKTETEFLLSILKKELNVNCINFRILDRRSFKSFGWVADHRGKLKKELSPKDTFYAIHDMDGFDEYYAIRSDNIAIEDTSLESIDTSAMKKGQLAKTFIKLNASRGTSRVILSRFISTIAA